VRMTFQVKAISSCMWHCSASILILFCLLGCTREKDHKGTIGPVAGNSSFDLSSQEEAELLAKAKNGDNDAAYRLYEYYNFVRLDFEQSFFWIEKAAERGNAKAQYNLGVILLDRERPQYNPERARYWFSKAAEQGNSLAKKELKKPGNARHE